MTAGVLEHSAGGVGIARGRRTAGRWGERIWTGIQLASAGMIMLDPQLAAAWLSLCMEDGGGGPAFLRFPCVAEPEGRRLG